MKNMLLALTTLLATTAFATEPITGMSAICLGTTTQLSNATPGGRWSISNAGVASINENTGEITGKSAGTVLVTYTVPGADKALFSISIVPVGAPIQGSTNVCTGGTARLSGIPGGTWSANKTEIAEVDTYTGVVTGKKEGNATISYSFGGSCITYHNISVEPCNRSEKKKGKK
jgi:hypothetical protein